MLADTVPNLTYVVRTLLRAPSFTVGALLTFAIGIGLNVAVFAVVDRVLFRPLPFSELESLATAHPVDPKTGNVYFMMPKSVAMAAKETAAAIADIGFAGLTRPVYVEGPEQMPLRLTEASFNLLDLLGVRPILGRSFTREDVRAKRRLILLREEVWRSRFAADPQIQTRYFSDGRGPIEVVGVLPAGWVNPSINWATPSDGLSLSSELLESGGGRGGLPGIVLRLRADGTVALAQQQIDALVVSLQSDLPENQRTRIVVEPIQAGIFWNVREKLWLLFIGGTLVWLVACANLATLMAARGRARARQMVIRASLGASRARIVLLTFLESIVLCGLGSLFALLVLIWALRLVGAVVPASMQWLTITTVDGRVIGLVGGLGLAGAAIAALYPAWLIARIEFSTESLRTTGSVGVSRRSGRLLLIFQSAVGALLVIVGGLVGRSFTGLMRTDLGFSLKDLYVINLQRTAGVAVESRASLYDELLATIRAQPGVAGVSGADFSVVDGQAGATVSDEAGHSFLLRHVLPDYFEVMKTPILAGRALPDRHDASSVVLSVSAARSIWPDLPANVVIGREIKFANQPARRVVGVVQDTRERHASSVRSEVFLPYASSSPYPPMLVARTQPSTPLDVPALREAIRRRVGTTITLSVFPVSQRLDPWLQDPRFYAYFFGAFGTLGLILCAVGLFALTSFEVSLRRHEMGIRVALGASAATIQRLLIREAATSIGIGVIIGSLLAFWVGQSLQALLHRVDARDLGTYAVVGVVLIATAVLAAWWPARRAGKADPLFILRSE